MKKIERELVLKEKLEKMSSFDEAIRGGDFPYIGGVDEVGRGPLAGPVVCACVVLPRDFRVLGIDDSKKISEKKRNELATIIKEESLSYGVGMASEKIIDEINILEATKGAMRVAIEEANKKLIKKEGENISKVVFDAITLKDFNLPQKSVIKGDTKSLSIAAASILAKVTRDAMMVKYNEVYPGYSFDKNKGYGTKAHYEGIEKKGICEIHRKTFLKKIL